MLCSRIYIFVLFSGTDPQHINNVDITPCDQQPCEFKHGINVTVKVNFIAGKTDVQHQAFHIFLKRGRRVRDRMVVGFTTTYAISAYHH